MNGVRVESEAGGMVPRGNSGHSRLWRDGGADAAGTRRRVEEHWVCFPDWLTEPFMTEGRWPSRQGCQSVMQASTVCIYQL